MLDVKRLRLLVELSRRGTIAAVAESLSYSPSAVSQQLAVLEKEAGGRLLEPAGRRLRLTAEGQVLVAHAEVVLLELERAEASLESARRGVAGTLRLAAFQSAALTIVPPALIVLGTSHPDLRIEVTELEPEASLPALVAGDFDVVLGEEYPGYPRPHLRGVDREDLVTDELRLAVPAAWRNPGRAGRAGRPGLADPAGLAERPFVMEPDVTTAREWAMAWCRSQGFEPDVRFTTSDLQLHLRLVEAGLAAALLPDLALTVHREGVRLVDLEGKPVRQVFTATRQGARQRPAVTTLVTALKASHRPR